MTTETVTKPATKLYNKAGLAKQFGLSIPAINVYIQEGMSVAEQGKGGKQSLFNLEDCKSWIDARLEGGDASMSDLKRRKLQIDVDLAEITLMRERGLVVEIDEVAKQLEVVLSNVKGKLLALPTKTSGLVLGMENQKEIQTVLDTAVREVLEELSGFNTK